MGGRPCKGPDHGRPPLQGVWPWSATLAGGVVGCLPYVLAVAGCARKRLLPLWATAYGLLPLRAGLGTSSNPLAGGLGRS
ncbi:hypothetical protein BHE74_00032638 [Ensete ventricosum]|nr:hypothetical protein BHE74_00032638 [Ensete ventricosum]RZS28369.1 hypothetical protein BHM03_00061931 [Ensete ventricosum]